MTDTLRVALTRLIADDGRITCAVGRSAAVLLPSDDGPGIDGEAALSTPQERQEAQGADHG